MLTFFPTLIFFAKTFRRRTRGLIASHDEADQSSEGYDRYSCYDRVYEQAMWVAEAQRVVADVCV